MRTLSYRHRVAHLRRRSVFLFLECSCHSHLAFCFRFPSMRRRPERLSRVQLQFLRQLLYLSRKALPNIPVFHTKSPALIGTGTFPLQGQPTRYRSA
jgi:hypothetical protein